MRTASLPMLLGALIGCSGADLEQGDSVGDAYYGRRGPSLVVSDAPTPIAQDKVVPVITAPEIFAVYVPGHIDPDRDMLVGEHWLFVKLREASWNLLKNPKKAVTPGGAAGMNRIRGALPRVRALDSILIPHEKEYNNGR